MVSLQEANVVRDDTGTELHNKGLEADRAGEDATERQSHVKFGLLDQHVSATFSICRECALGHIRCDDVDGQVVYASRPFCLKDRYLQTR